MKLGIDIGGVIIDRVADDSDTSFFGGRYLETPAVPDAFAVIAALRPGFESVYLVSKCGKNTERKTREWLAHTGFHETTGVPAENVHFCRQRHEKAPICESLGITHFVDDRLEVLAYLASVERRFLFRPQEDEVAEHRLALPAVTRVESWLELRSRL